MLHTAHADTVEIIFEYFKVTAAVNGAICVSDFHSLGWFLPLCYDTEFCYMLNMYMDSFKNEYEFDQKSSGLW